MTAPTLSIAYDVNVATSEVTSVPFGTITKMVLLFSSIIPVATGFVKEKAVMGVAVESGVVPAPLTWLQAARRTIKDATLIIVAIIFFIIMPPFCFFFAWTTSLTNQRIRSSFSKIAYTLSKTIIKILSLKT